MTATFPDTNRTNTANGLAIAALVCGLVGLVLGSVLLGPLAIIFGAVAWSKANRGASRKHMAIAGTILGVVDLVLFVVVLVLATHHGGYWHIG